MKQLSAYLADQMYVYRLIEEDDQRYYSYSLQLIIEKIVVTVLICLFAILFKRLGEILLFLLVFSVIRMNSDGIHCKTSIGCFVASVVMSLSTILISDYMFPVICKLGVALSAIIIFLIGTIRDPNLRLTDAEYEHLRKRSRIGIIFVGAIVMLFCSFSPKDNYVPYMALGIIYNAFSLLIVKLLRKEVRTDDEA